MKSNIVYQYFKKETNGEVVYIQFDPIRLKGAQLTIDQKGEIEVEEVEFGSELPQELEAAGFIAANALEYHLILKGLA